MAIKSRGQLIDVMDTVQLRIVFRDQFGAPANLDSFPQITITQPSGNILTGPTSAGVYQVSTGTYGFDYTIGMAGPYGVWVDTWVGYLNGFRMEAAFNFVVSHTDQPAINSDGYVSIGDDPGFNYSQTAILNLNKLIKTLKARLNSGGKSRSTDKYGNVDYVDCDIYSVEMLATFIAASLSQFNEVPYFTFFTLEDTQIINQFHNIFVEGATLMALASQSLIERGREFNITDNGITFTPPSMSELLNTQYGTLLTNYYDKLKYIKNSMRSSPLGLGTLKPLTANSPYIMRLRHLKERQVI